MKALLSIRSIRDQIQSTFQSFFQRSSSAGILILVFTAVAMLWTNSMFHESYEALLHQPIEVTLFNLSLDFTFEHFVNDGLMVLFFLVVGLEIKREILVGELSSTKKAALPMVAAVAGMAVPGLIYLMFNADTPDARGWGVPVATDIAFALGILALLGNRVPLGLKVFLAALAIVDDLLAVLVIAIFYTGTLNISAIVAAAVFVMALVVLNRSGISNVGLYGVLGVGLWVAILFSGIHATVAGVVLALTIPATSRINTQAFAARVRALVLRIEEKVVDNEDKGSQLDVVHTLEDMCEDVQSPLHRIEHGLQPYISFFVMPVFALVNAGVQFDPSVVSKLASPVGLGIILGLFIGKQVGVTIAVWLSVKLRLAELPHRVNMKQMYGVSLLCGIGFTMALFVAHLAFAPGVGLDTAKLSVLVGSSISALVGTLVLSRWLPSVQQGPAV